MLFESWCLLQCHAAALDSAALLLFLRRERIAKERQARSWRLWHDVERGRDDPGAEEQRVMRAHAKRWHQSWLECQQQERDDAIAEFTRLFPPPPKRAN